MTNPYISVEKEQAMKGYWTVALFGVDSRDSSVGKGNMSDVIIICNINQETGEIKLVSLFRDTDDPSVGGMGKFDGLGMQVEAFILSPVKLVTYDGTMQT